MPARRLSRHSSRATSNQRTYNGTSKFPKRPWGQMATRSRIPVTALSLSLLFFLLPTHATFAQEATSPPPIVRPAPPQLNPRLLPAAADRNSSSAPSTTTFPPSQSFSTSPPASATAPSVPPITHNDLRSSTSNPDSGASTQLGEPEQNVPQFPQRQAASAAWDAQPLPPRADSRSSELEYLDSLDAAQTQPTPPMKPQEPLQAMSPDQLGEAAWNGSGALPAMPAEAARGQNPSLPVQTPAGQGFYSQQAPSIPDAASSHRSNPTPPMQSTMTNGVEESHSVLDTGEVQAASFNQVAPLDERNLANQIAMANQLVQQYSVDQVAGPLPGQPVTLRDLLQRTPAQLHKAMIS